MKAAKAGKTRKGRHFGKARQTEKYKENGNKNSKSV